AELPLRTNMAISTPTTTITSTAINASNRQARFALLDFAMGAPLNQYYGTSYIRWCVVPQSGLGSAWAPFSHSPTDGQTHQRDQSGDARQCDDDRKHRENGGNTTTRPVAQRATQLPRRGGQPPQAQLDGVTAHRQRLRRGERTPCRTQRRTHARPATLPDSRGIRGQLHQHADRGRRGTEQRHDRQ